jgi:hypothetical protein
MTDMGRLQPKPTVWTDRPMLPTKFQTRLRLVSASNSHFRPVTLNGAVATN